MRWVGSSPMFSRRSRGGWLRNRRCPSTTSVILEMADQLSRVRAFAALFSMRLPDDETPSALAHSRSTSTPIRSYQTARSPIPA